MHFHQDFDQKDTFVLQLKCSSSEQKHDNYLPKHGLRSSETQLSRNKQKTIYVWNRNAQFARVAW